ncbi:MAG: T9SS type A sorting domain-containing protein [Bacteroidota bacterium]
MYKFLLILPALLLPHLTAANPYYSRTDGSWSSSDTWSLSIDGPPAFESPSSGDTVYIRHTVIHSAGSTYTHTGNVIIESDGYLHIDTGTGSSKVYKFEGNRFEIYGTLTTSSDFFHQKAWSNEYGILILHEGSGFAVGDDLILCGTSETILNTIACGNASTLDDIYFYGTQSKLCGQGHFIIMDRMRAWNDSGSEITPASTQIVNQICAGFELFDDPGTCINPVIEGGGTFVLSRRNFYLSARPTPQHVRLRWQADLREEGALYFIERSFDGAQFQMIGPPRPAHPDKKHMHAHDRRPPIGSLYYRIKQVNQSGLESYSDIVSVEFLGPNPRLQLSQKPEQRNLLQVRGYPPIPNLGLRVFNSNGTLVQETTISSTQNGSAELILPSNLPAGVYVVKLSHPSSNLQARFILL